MSIRDALEEAAAPLPVGLSIYRPITVVPAESDVVMGLAHRHCQITGRGTSETTLQEFLVWVGLRGKEGAGDGRGRS